jgi:hypothetical protein
MRIILAIIFWIHLVGGHAAVTNEFLEAGIAAPNREWLANDYISAANILASGKVALPRYSNKNGKALLETMTSPANFAIYRKKNLRLDSRMNEFLSLQQASGTLLRLYVEAANKGDDLHKETASLMAFNLYVTELGMELTDEFVPTIPKDEKYEIRMDGLKKMYSGMTTIFVGAESSLSERHFYSDEDCSLLLEAMSETIGRIKKAFTAEYRVELGKKLELQKSKFKKQTDLRRIEAVLNELRPKD